MTEDRKIIRAEVGLLGLAKQLGNVAQAGGMMGHGRDSLSRSKELRDRGGAPAPPPGTLPPRAAPEGPGRSGDRGGRRSPRRSSTTRLGPAPPAPRLERASEARPDHRAVRGPRRLGPARPHHEAAPAEGARGEEDGPGTLHPHREPARGLGEGRGRRGAPWRVRGRVPRLRRGSGHVPRRHAGGRRPGPPTDRHRHLRRGRLRQAPRPRDAAHRRRPARRPGHPVPRRARAAAAADPGRGRGTEYRGSRDRHGDELHPAVGDIDHGRTKTKSPRTNGIVERFHETIPDECHRIAPRKKVCDGIEARQADLDAWMAGYNRARPHQGRYRFGTAPMRTFLDAAPSAREEQPGEPALAEHRA